MWEIGLQMRYDYNVIINLGNLGVSYRIFCWRGESSAHKVCGFFSPLISIDTLFYAEISAIHF